MQHVGFDISVIYRFEFEEAHAKVLPRVAFTTSGLDRTASGLPSVKIWPRCRTVKRSQTEKMTSMSCSTSITVSFHCSASTRSMRASDRDSSSVRPAAGSSSSGTFGRPPTVRARTTQDRKREQKGKGVASGVKHDG